MISLYNLLDSLFYERNNEIVFSSPDQRFTRCSTGCETLWNWKRPSECNLCEITGFTQEYGCHYFPDNSLNIRLDPSVSSFDECIVLCKVCKSSFCNESCLTSFRTNPAVPSSPMTILNKTVVLWRRHRGMTV